MKWIVKVWPAIGVNTWTVWDWMLRTRPVSDGRARERIGGVIAEFLLELPELPVPTILSFVFCKTEKGRIQEEEEEKASFVFRLSTVDAPFLFVSGYMVWFRPLDLMCGGDFDTKLWPVSIEAIGIITWKYGNTLILFQLWPVSNFL